MSKLTDIFAQLGVEPAPVEEISEAPTASTPVVIDVDGNSDRLSRLVDTSLGALEEILQQPTPPLHNPLYAKMLSIKKDAAVSVINAGLKADENRFRKRKNDVLGILLDQIKADKGRAPVLIDQRP